VSVSDPSSHLDRPEDSMTIALISDLFFGEQSEERLQRRLAEAQTAGAVLAILPELPLDPWYPAREGSEDEESEGPGGRRYATLAEAAATAQIGLVGGAIVRDPESPEHKFNTTFVFDATGDLVGQYRKSHLPHEPGFWERSHYQAGDIPPRPFQGFALPFGLQVCSDVNRPVGSQVLGALGAELIAVPRATEPKTYARWRLVFQSIAVTASVFVASVNRPQPEFDVEIGGPSVVVAPDGEVLLETTAPVAVATIDRGKVRLARSAYPGYLPIRADLYSRSWEEVERSAATIDRLSRC
jgi:predicted amidohydrolase